MSFNTALSGLNAAAADLNVKSNNIANVNTTGYKESRAEFADVFAVSAFGSSDTAIGNGTVLNNVAQQFEQGNLEFTDNALDLGISGQGFFALAPNQQSDEIIYTRAGAALDSITAMITTMDEMSAAISSAANEQSSVAEDINRGIVNISQIAEHTAEGARETSAAVETMASLSSQLQEAASKFKV